MKRVYPTSCAAQQGFTMVELMIAVGLSGVVMAFIFSINSLMFGAFGTQSAVANVADGNRAAMDQIVRDVRAAGAGLPQFGAMVWNADTSTATLVGAIKYIDGAPGAPGTGAGSDEIIVLYAMGEPVVWDPSTAVSPGNNLVLEGEAIAEWKAGDPIIIRRGESACVMQVSSAPTVAGTSYNVEFGAFPTAPLNQAGSTQCATTYFSTGAFALSRAKFVRYKLFDNSAYPDRVAAGELLRNTINPFNNDVVTPGAYEVMGTGFTNLQFAVRFYDPGGTDLDGDGDPLRNWYSYNQTNTFSPSVVATHVTVSIERRNTNEDKNINSFATPPYGDQANLTHNSVGNWAQPCTGNPQYDPVCGVKLEATPVMPSGSPATMAARYSSNYVYRGMTTTVVLRNTGGQL